MSTLGNQLRIRRQQAGLGLRTFAELIDQRPSEVSAVESGRRPLWRDAARHKRIGQVLGTAGQLSLPTTNGAVPADENVHSLPGGRIRWWWTADHVPPLAITELAALADFLQIEPVVLDKQADAATPHWPAHTELAIEWQVGKLLGKPSGQSAAAPVDVEAVLESRAGLRLEIVPGLIPRHSVQACAVESGKQLTFYVDRIVADSRPLASYRLLLASCYAVCCLGGAEFLQTAGADWFYHLQQSEYQAWLTRDCQRFALAMMLPATPVLGAAEAAYTELVLDQGWVELEEAARIVRNRLAEQFSVPPSLVQRRLTGWPCHLYGRIAQALAAEETTLPPSDWLTDSQPTRQRMLFEQLEQHLKG